jgi:ketosteroid isomerase-like protein
MKLLTGIAGNGMAPNRSVTGFSRLFPMLAISLALLAGCDIGSDGGTATNDYALSALDLERERQMLLAHDLRFAAAVQESGVASAYRQFMAADAIQLPDGGSPIAGREEIYQELQDITEGLDFYLSWEPLEAQVAASGELGFTWGIYYFESSDEIGAPYIAEGKYVFLWKKNAGRWELILDISNETDPFYDDEIVLLEEDTSGAEE